MYNSTLSLTLGLDRQGWSIPCPCCCTSGKTLYPLYRRLGGLQCWSGRVQKFLPRTRIRSLYHPAGSNSLYCLCYPGPHFNHIQPLKPKSLICVPHTCFTGSYTFMVEEKWILNY